MYPYPSSQTLHLLQEEKIKHAQEQLSAPSSLGHLLQQGTRSLAHLLGVTFLALGTRLERVGLEGR